MSGLRAVAIYINDLGHRCGYVGIEQDHPLYGVAYHEKAECLKDLLNETLKLPRKNSPVMVFLAAGMDDDERCRPDIVFRVHGGLTYSGGDDYPIETNPKLWWFGFDCSHYGDGTNSQPGIHRSLKFVIQECESLANQLSTLKGASDETNNQQTS